MPLAAGDEESGGSSKSSNLNLGLEESSFDSTWFEQLRVLFGREATVRGRSKILTKAVIGRSVIITFLISTIYLQVGQDQQGVFSIMGGLSFIIINATFT